MSFFKKVFNTSGGGDDTQDSGVRELVFGRYTEVNKSPQQLAYWTKAQDEFVQKRYADSFYSLLQYMRDPAADNIRITDKAGAVEFEILQGSKVIRGRGDQKGFTAEARIARFEKLSVVFLRKLMNMNFVLQYTRFAIRDDIIYLKFDTKAIDASPSKVYYSLKELALKADRMDDQLVDEFDALQAVDCDHIIRLPEAVIEVKYKYFRKWIEDTMAEASGYNPDRMAGGISYLLLSLLFRIDYLLQPQGNMLDAIDKINQLYNAKDNKSTEEKNRMMTDEFRRLLEMPREKVVRDFYDVRAAFGFVPASTHKQFYEFLLAEFKNTGWYYDNNYPAIVTRIYEWMTGYALIYYGLFPATYDFLRIIYMVLYPDFFAEMGMPSQIYDHGKQAFNRTALEKEILKVLKKHVKEYPKLAVLTQKINTRSLNEFLYTYLNELTYLDFTKQ